MGSSLTTKSGDPTPALSVRARESNGVLDLDGVYSNGRIWPY